MLPAPFLRHPTIAAKPRLDQSARNDAERWNDAVHALQ